MNNQTQGTLTDFSIERVEQHAKLVLETIKDIQSRRKVPEGKQQCTVLRN